MSGVKVKTAREVGHCQHTDLLLKPVESGKFMYDSRSKLYFAGLQSFAPQIPFCLQPENCFEPKYVFKKCHPDSGGNSVSLLSSAHPTLHPWANSAESDGNKQRNPPHKEFKTEITSRGRKRGRLFFPQLLEVIEENFKSWSYSINTTQAKSIQVSRSPFTPLIQAYRYNSLHTFFQAPLLLPSGKCKHICTLFHSPSYSNAQKGVSHRTPSAAGVSYLLGVWLHNSALPSH